MKFSPSDRGRSVRPHTRSRLTPIPLINRKTKQRTSPGVPPTYVFTIPNNAADGGVKHTAPTNAALRRSSATHFPARFLRHFLIRRSERRPASGAPTFHVSGKKRNGRGSQMSDCGREEEGCKSGTNSDYRYQRA